MPISEYLRRVKLDIKSNLRYIFRVTKYGNQVCIPTNYHQVFYDDFKQSFTEKWTSGDHWGINPYHPDDLKCWYDEHQIQKTTEGIELDAIYKPKYFEEIQKTIPNAIGIIRTNESWKYGIFKIVAKLPVGQYLWPALWMSGSKLWPPEIDIVEAWSENTIDYDSNRHLTTNIHYSVNGEHKYYGTYKHRLPNQITMDFIEYVLWWEQNFIKIYYNGYLILDVRHNKYLNGMNDNQKIILNNGIDENFKECNRPLVVNSVEVFQKR